jgi:hypothetical protein
MANFGEAFRAEALAKTGDTVFRCMQGWKFGLSFGFLRAPTREEYNHVLSGHGSAFATKHAKHLPATYEEFIERHELQLELLKANGITDCTWVLSASLFPRGRPSTERDWQYLGEMIAAIKAPMNALKTPFDTTHPSDATGSGKKRRARRADG